MLGTFFGKKGRRGSGGPWGEVGVDTAAPSCRRQSGGAGPGGTATRRADYKRGEPGPRRHRPDAQQPAGLGRCTIAGAWYDRRGAMAAHTCAEHRELTGSCRGRECLAGASWIGWLPARVGWNPVGRTPEDGAPAEAVRQNGSYSASASVRSRHPSHGHVSSRTIVCNRRGSRVVNFK
jgi:hypothetical protein